MLTLKLSAWAAFTIFLVMATLNPAGPILQVSGVMFIMIYGAISFVKDIIEWL